MEKKEEEMFALANFDPMKVKEIQMMPISEYYLILSHRVKMDEAEKKANKKK